ncbi:MAG: hypothetical protein IJT97_05070 [Bacteroidaceae bacterium]|nr:hypothetical protein [Bacteroidaceae bacterium]
MFTIFSIGCMFSVAGAFLHSVLKGGDKRIGKGEKSEKEFYEWLAEGFDRRNHDDTHSNMRWVKEHFGD